MRRKRNRYHNIVSLIKDSVVGFNLEYSNSILINNEFLDYYTEDEALNFLDITKELFVKTTYTRGNGTVFCHLENVTSVEWDSIIKRTKLTNVSGRPGNRLSYKSHKKQGMKNYLCYH